MWHDWAWISTPEEGKSKSFRGARKRPFAYAQRQVVGDIRVVDWRQQSPLLKNSKLAIILKKRYGKL